MSMSCKKAPKCPALSCIVLHFDFENLVDTIMAVNDGEMSNEDNNLHTKLKEVHRMKQDFEQALVKAKM